MANDGADENAFFFQNLRCRYFPCHPTEHPEDFNCLFCYCPLYTLGESCGGDFSYTASGVKDCSACLVPHGRGAFEHIRPRFPELARLAARKDK